MSHFHFLQAFSWIIFSMRSTYSVSKVLLSLLMLLIASSPWNFNHCNILPSSLLFFLRILVTILAKLLFHSKPIYALVNLCDILRTPYLLPSALQCSMNIDIIVKCESLTDDNRNIQMLLDPLNYLQLVDMIGYSSLPLSSWVGQN